MNLIVRSGPDAGSSIAVDRRITIGREGDLRLTDPTVSRMHAAATPSGQGRVLLEDLGSTGGTVVNGTRLFGPVTLQGGEQILMGTSILEFEVAVAAPAPAPATVPVPPVAPDAAIPAPPVVPPPPTPSPVLPPSAPSSGAADKRKKQLLIVVAVAAAIAAAVIGFILLSGGDDDPVAGNGAGGTGATAGEQILAPLSNLAAAPGAFSTDPTTWVVTLTWDAAPAELGLDHYEVSRNGKRIAADVVETTLVDESAVPGEELNYEVIAVGSAGTTEVAATVVAPPELAVGDATVDGTWTVQMRITKSNLDDIGASADLTWDFEPSCAFGPCDATFTIRRTDLIGAIALIGGTQGEYTGVGSGLFLLDDCRGDPIVEDVTVDLTVKRAAVKAGIWAAQTFKGRLVETAVSSGCITARRTFAISGTRV